MPNDTFLPVLRPRGFVGWDWSSCYPRSQNRDLGHPRLIQEHGVPRGTKFLTGGFRLDVATTPTGGDIRPSM
jgi:hypothetical protein